MILYILGTTSFYGEIQILAPIIYLFLDSTFLDSTLVLQFLVSQGMWLCKYVDLII